MDQAGEFENELESSVAVAMRHSRPHSYDGSSVKEVDPAAHFQQVHSEREEMPSEGPAVTEKLQNNQLAKEGVHSSEDSTIEDDFEFEDLLDAGRDELLKTTVLSLSHLSNEKVVSLMQLILETSGHTQGSPQLSKMAIMNPTAPGLRLFSKFMFRVKTFVSVHFITTPRPQLFKLITLARSSRKGRGVAMQMSEAVAEVLEGRYLSDLQHLALPPCNVSIIVRALIYGQVSTLQHLELQSSSQFSSSKPLRRLFMSDQLGKLRYLRLSRCVEAEEMEALAVALDAGRLPRLTHLDLSHNSLQVTAGSKYFAKLMRCKALAGLEHLNLHDSGISDVGSQALANAIKAKGPWQLRHLNLGSNDIGDVGFAALLRVMKADRLPQLQELHLLYNYGIGQESKVEAAAILEKGHVPRLQVVYLSSHSITERVAEALLKAYKNNSAVIVELRGIWWPSELIERDAAHYRERNLALLASGRKTLHLQQLVPHL